MRVRRYALAVHFLPIVVELLRGQAPEHEGARVDPGCRVALHEDQVAAVRVGRGVPEVVEADVVEHRRRREARDVAADVGVLVRAQHHRHGVPADVMADLLLDVEVAGKVRLAIDRDRVDVRGVRGERQVGAGLSRGIDEVLNEEMGAGGTFGGEDAGQRIQPFACFLGIGVAFHHVHRGSPDGNANAAGLCCDNACRWVCNSRGLRQYCIAATRQSQRARPQISAEPDPRRLPPWCGNATPMPR